MIFKHLNAEGAETTCSLALTHLWAEVYGIDQRGSGTCSADEWSVLIEQALRAAGEKGAKSVVFRTIESLAGNEELIRKLPDLGFTFKEGRREYRAFLSDLPGDTETPFQWQTAQELGWNERRIADFLLDVAWDSPGFDADEDPFEFIKDWLKDPILKAGPECVSIGFLNGKPSALVVAQVNPRTLWSRLSYIGLIPECRRQSLGRWIHRHGFVRLEAQGGDLYHGGTNSENAAMIRLFENHGCRPYHRMQEWVWKRTEEESR